MVCFVCLFIWTKDHRLRNCIHVVVIVATQEARQPVELATLLLIIIAVLLGVAVIVIIALVCYGRRRMNATAGEIV